MTREHIENSLSDSFGINLSIFEFPKYLPEHISGHGDKEGKMCLSNFHVRAKMYSNVKAALLENWRVAFKIFHPDRLT